MTERLFPDTVFMKIVRMNFQFVASKKGQRYLKIMLGKCESFNGANRNPSFSLFFFFFLENFWSIRGEEGK